MKVFKMVSITLLAVLMSVSLLAESGAKRDGERGKHFKEMMTELKLSSEQIEKIKANRQSHKERRKDVRKKVRALKDQIKNDFISGVSDSDLKASHVKLAELKKSMADLKFDKMVFMKNILNKEQREKFMELRKKDHRRKRR